MANVPILYSLKTQENRRFSGVFTGVQNGITDPKWAKQSSWFLVITESTKSSKTSCEIFPKTFNGKTTLHMKFKLLLPKKHFPCNIRQ